MNHPPKRKPSKPLQAMARQFRGWLVRVPDIDSDPYISEEAYVFPHTSLLELSLLAVSEKSARTDTGIVCSWNLPELLPYLSQETKDRIRRDSAAFYLSRLPLRAVRMINFDKGVEIDKRTAMAVVATALGPSHARGVCSSYQSTFMKEVESPEDNPNHNPYPNPNCSKNVDYLQYKGAAAVDLRKALSPLFAGLRRALDNIVNVRKAVQAVVAMDTKTLESHLTSLAACTEALQRFYFPLETLEPALVAFESIIDRMLTDGHTDMTLNPNPNPSQRNLGALWQFFERQLNLQSALRDKYQSLWSRMSPRNAPQVLINLTNLEDSDDDDDDDEFDEEIVPLVDLTLRNDSSSPYPDEHGVTNPSTEASFTQGLLSTQSSTENITRSEKDTQAAKEAFNQMLSELGIDESTKFEDVIAVCKGDDRWEALRTATQRSDALSDYQTQLRLEGQARKDFMEMLCKRPDVDNRTSWQNAQTILGTDSRFKKVAEAERQDLFLQFVTDSQKEAQAQEAFAKLLLEHPGINHNTTWEEAKNILANEPRFMDVAKSERIKLFDQFGKDSWERKAQARNAFTQLLHEHPEITYQTSWRNSKQILEDEPRYNAIEDEDREDLFDEYIKKGKQDGRTAFMDLLRQKSDIVFESYWFEHREYFENLNDPRLQALEDWELEEIFECYVSGLRTNVNEKEERGQSHSMPLGNEASFTRPVPKIPNCDKKTGNAKPEANGRDQLNLDLKRRKLDEDTKMSDQNPKRRNLEDVETKADKSERRDYRIPKKSRTTLPLSSAHTVPLAQNRVELKNKRMRIESPQESSLESSSRPTSSSSRTYAATQLNTHIHKGVSSPTVRVAANGAKPLADGMRQQMETNQDRQGQGNKIQSYKHKHPRLIANRNPNPTPTTNSHSRSNLNPNPSPNSNPNTDSTLNPNPKSDSTLNPNPKTDSTLNPNPKPGVIPKRPPFPRRPFTPLRFSVNAHSTPAHPTTNPSPGPSQNQFRILDPNLDTSYANRSSASSYPNPPPPAIPAPSFTSALNPNPSPGPNPTPRQSPNPAPPATPPPTNPNTNPNPNSTPHPIPNPSDPRTAASSSSVDNVQSASSDLTDDILLPRITNHRTLRPSKSLLKNASVARDSTRRIYFSENLPKHTPDPSSGYITVAQYFSERSRDTDNERTNVGQQFALSTSMDWRMDRAIYDACRRTAGAMDRIYALVESGMDPNFARPHTEIGETALIAAALSGSLEAVNWLLDHGADPNKADKKGKRPAAFARENGFEEVAKRLHEHGQNAA